MDVRPRTFRMILISLQMMWIGHRPMVIGRSATWLCAIGQCCHVEEDNITCGGPNTLRLWRDGDEKPSYDSTLFLWWDRGLDKMSVWADYILLDIVYRTHSVSASSSQPFPVPGQRENIVFLIIREASRYWSIPIYSHYFQCLLQILVASTRRLVCLRTA